MPTIDYFPKPRTTGAIGVGSVGDTLAIGQAPFPWQETVLVQYANSPILVQWIASFSAAVDQTANLDNWYDNVFNIQTCGTFGLDVWGRIVVVDRILPLPPPDYFGFNEGGSFDYTPFGEGPFYSGEILNNGFRLENEAYRRLIYAKAAANIWDGTILHLNAILRLLFPGRVVYVEDNGGMHMTYVFKWQLTPMEKGVAISSGILPRPNGVRVSYSEGA